MFKTIDLFAGIGGIRRAFEKTGEFENVISAEIDRYACITYKHLYGEDPFNDVTSEEFKKRVSKIDYDVLLAGFPCQSFSIAGKKEGFKDKTRGTLFFDVADIISRTKPKAFLLENVEGLLTHKKGETFKVILETLIKELGYKIIGADEKENGEIVFNRNSFLRSCKNFGLPQKRTRTYIIGFRKDLIPKGYEFKELPIGRNDLNIYRNLNDLLELKNDKKYYMSSGGLETLKRHKRSHGNKGNGFGYEVVNDLSIKNPIANTILATGGSGKERNLVYDPQNGIGGKVIKGKQTPLNNEGIRIMTPREWGKLQGFINYAFVNEQGIDEFTFPEGVSDTQLYKQFGNSVAIPVLEELAKYIYKNLKCIMGDNKMRYNIGEWSEIYTFLKCLVDGKFYVKNSTLEDILAKYDILKIYKRSYLNDSNYCFKPKLINKSEYDDVSKQVLIKLRGSTPTTFEIPILEEFARKEDFSLSKGSSFNKSDLEAQIRDHYGIESNKMEYSIKSQLASPATLLNASSHTNFEYRIRNISSQDVIEINDINTRTKLKDRINKIYEKGYSIESLGAKSHIFKSNLCLIDGDLENILGFILLYSYRYNKKNLVNLIALLIEKNPLNFVGDVSLLYKEKLSRFLSEITASMVPGRLVGNLKASNNIFGGVLLVERNGEISLLDNLHYKNELKNYLSENLKLDTPSTSRYHMLELEYDSKNNEATFTLNLQIRFK